LLSLPELTDIWFPPGAEIERRYTISSFLGQGGLGTVFMAYDKVLNKPVALKFFRNSLFGKDRGLIEGEVALSQRVSHVNVCRVHDLNVEYDPPYMSMEYIDGEDLEQTLQRVGRIVPDRAVQISMDICAGLSAAHAQGVVHGDLKPHNVMIDGAGIARLTDFGLGRLAIFRDSLGPHAGTPPYMAPEQVSGRSANERSDLFSLGIVLYELYTGEYPLAVDEEGGSLNWETSRVVPPSDLVPQIEPHVERTILQCLEIAPEDRPASVKAVMQRLAGEQATPNISTSDRAAAYESRFQKLRWLAIAAIAGLVASWIAVPQFRLVERIDFARSSVADYWQAATHLIAALGYKAEHTAGKYSFGFDYDSPFVNDPTAPDQTVSYWYRQSPSFLVPHHFTISREQTTSQVTFDEPPWTEPGMVGARISTDGTLLEFRSVPGALGRGKDGGTSRDASIAKLFASAGLKVADFAVLPDGERMIGPTTESFASFGESRMYRSKSNPTVLHVQLNLVEDEIVWFKMDNADGPKATGKPMANRINEALYLLFMVFAVVGCFLARRNLALGRADRRGAWRCSALVFVASLVSWCFSASHLPLFEGEVQLAQFGFANALFWAGTQWLVYMSFEPFLRQDRAGGMVSWTRAINGQWRDPLVARDILSGCMVGAILTPLLGTLCNLVPWRIGAPGRFEIPALDLGTLEHPTFMFAIVADALVNAMYSGFILVLLPIVLSRILGSRWLGIGAAWLVLTLLFGFFYGSGITPWQDQVAWFAYMGIWAAAYQLVVQRFGLLATVAMVATLQSVIFTPSTLDWDRWYAATGMAMGLGMAALIGGYAAWVIMDRRPRYVVH
jgi:serine/threonine protein kinase